MTDHLTGRSRSVLSLAQLEAKRFGHDSVRTEHILIGLVKEGTGVACVVLKKMGVKLNEAIEKAKGQLLCGAELEPSLKDRPYTLAAERVQALAREEASRLGHHSIGTEHLLLGLLAERNGGAAKVLTGLGLELDRTREAVVGFLGTATPAVAATLPSPPPACPDAQNAEETPSGKTGEQTAETTPIAGMGGGGT